MERTLIMFLQYVLITIVSCVLHVTAPESRNDQQLSEDESISDDCYTETGTYTGQQSITICGRICVAWSMDTPHSHTYHNDYMFPDGNDYSAANFCRDPGRDEYLWSYTVDPAKRWDECLIPSCNVSGWTEPCITDDTSRHCYEMFDTEITWKNASDLCKHDGGNLVIIESVEEQKFIADLMQKRTFNASGLWIGSDKLHPEEQRAWANGKKFSYVNWAPGEPSSHLIDENCVEIRTNDSTWNDVKCTERNGYICINPGWVSLVQKPRTWNDAFNSCDREGGKLTIIDSAEVQAEIHDLIGRFKPNGNGLWIGSNKLHPERKRTWTDGQKFTYVNWAEGEPNNLVENCVEMDTYNSTWNDRECTLLRGYICEKIRFTEPCIQDETSGHCYQILDTKMSWNKAFDFCIHDGGNLVTIESVEEQRFIADLMQKRTFNASGLWIGSNKLHPEEQRAWANGKKFSYVNWAPGEPNRHVIDENCVEIRTNDSTWNDVKCTERNWYICENLRAVKNYIQDNNTKRWYKLVDELITWDDAFNICDIDGGTLMIIETATEQTFIADQIRHTMFTARELWLGSNNVHPERKRTWINGNKFTYVNWAEGEPNNSPYVENCAEMHTYNSMWKVSECTLLRGFICEKTPEVTPYKVQELFIIITTVGSALVIFVGVTILCCLLHKRNKCKKKNEDHQDVQNVEMNQGEQEFNRANVLSDKYYTINVN